MISCVLAIVIYLSGIKLPYILTSSIRMVGSMTGPLAMMLLGSFLLDTDWKSLINQKIIAFTILKMLVLPIVVTLILKQFVDNTYLLAVLMAALLRRRAMSFLFWPISTIKKVILFQSKVLR